MTRSDRTPIEALRRQRMSMTPGTLDGRIGEARPIWTRESDEFVIDDSEAELGEVIGGNTVPNTTRFFNDTFIGDGSAVQVIQLSYTPIDNSEHIYFGGAYLSQKYWSRTERTITIENPNPYTGDPITVEYAYIVGQIPTNPAPVPLVYRDISYADSGDTQLALPTGTQVGDLIVAGAWRTNGVGFVDERMRQVADLPETFSGNEITATYWIGYASSLDSLVVDPIPAGIDYTDSFYACATFSPPNTLGESIFNTGPQSDNNVLVPSVYGHSSICIQMGGGVVTTPGLVRPPGYQSGGGVQAAGIAEFRADLWNADGDTTMISPEGIAVAGASLQGTWRSWVLATDAYEV